MGSVVLQLGSIRLEVAGEGNVDEVVQLDCVVGDGLVGAQIWRVGSAMAFVGWVEISMTLSEMEMRCEISLTGAALASSLLDGA